MNSLNKSMGVLSLVLTFGVIPLVFGYAEAEWGWDYGSVTPDSPVIERVLAAESISPGTTWRVYLWVSDPNSDIARLTYVVNQPGATVHYPGHLSVKPGADGRLQGYLYMNTVSMASATGWQMWFDVKITVEDSRGNRSLPKVFKVYFDGNRQDDVREWEKAQLASLGLEQPPLISRMHIELRPIGSSVGAVGINFIPGGP